MLQKYYFSAQNHVNCACCILWKQRGQPIVELLPDGETFQLWGCALRKKFIIENTIAIWIGIILFS